MSDDYSQPDFYRFNQDSIELINWIKNRRPETRNILDLGAGSGIIGIELGRNLNCEKVTLVELQDEFKLHLERNCENFLPSNVNFEIIINSFSGFNATDEFDLIVCNPPYYLPGKGELSKDRNRSLARAFLMDNWQVLLSKIGQVISPTGKAFIVLKNDLNFFNVLKKDAVKSNLEIKRNELKSLMVLELFRLNKN